VHIYKSGVRTAVVFAAHLFLSATALSSSDSFAAAASGEAATSTDAALLSAQREAEARAAIARAERAELLARLPPSTAKPLAGDIETKQFGAAGLVKAFDLAQELAAEVCAALPAGERAVVYEPSAAQGVLAARLVRDALVRHAADLAERSTELDRIIAAHAPQKFDPGSALALGLTVVPATLRAVADVSALFKSDVGAAGIAYGEGARGMFVTALQQHCPNRIGGLGTGYLGELDGRQYDALLAQVRALALQRGGLANRIAIVGRLADAAKGDEKKNLAALAASGAALLKTVDAFVDSLKAGEAGDKSPLFNAARYLAYAQRTDGMRVLDLDLRLEGMTIVKDNVFTGQKLRLSGVAFLWYRLHEPDGTVRLARTLRRMARPVEVDLRGAGVGGEFWGGSQRQSK